MQLLTRLCIILDIGEEHSCRPKLTQTPGPQGYLLSTVRQGQAAVIDTVRIWTGVTEQLAYTFRLPVPDVDLVGIVDRTFDLAEQTLAAQHQLARTLAGVATRQVATAAETAGTALAAVEATVDERLRRVEDLADAAEAEQEQPQPPHGTRRRRSRPTRP